MLASLVSGPARSAEEREGSTIRVVSSCTGLAMETLRAWERRYGFPKPERRPGSNRRLYSQADIERLLAIQRALAGGYRIGDVVSKSMGELGRLPLDRVNQDEPAVAVRPSSAAHFTQADCDQLIQILARDDLAELEAKLRFSAGSLGPRRFIVELAHPFAVAVGQAWADGRLSVRHEHLATECLITQLRQLLASYQDISGQPLVLLATLPGEHHTLSLQMVALFLVVVGAKPRMLGGNTPVRDMVDAAKALGADAVGITVTTTCDRTTAKKSVARLRKALPSTVQIWLGGDGAAALGFDDERTRIVGSWAAIEECVVLMRRRR